MFRKRIGGVVVVVVEDGLRECSQKNFFHTRKKIRFSMTTRVKSQLAYQENENFLFVYDLLILDRAHNKEHTQKGKQFLSCFLFSKIPQSVGK